jgi:hypothetical protein
MLGMFTSVILYVSLADAKLTVSHPELSMTVPVIVGKHSTPTPEGFYLVEKAYSSHLKMNMLVFKKDGKSVWALHPNLVSRKAQINSPSVADNYLSGGCVGVRVNDFERLWSMKQTMVLQVYGGKSP